MKRLLCGSLTAMLLTLPVLAQSAGTTSPSSTSTPSSTDMNSGPGTVTTPSSPPSSSPKDAQMQEEESSTETTVKKKEKTVPAGGVRDGKAPITEPMNPDLEEE